MASRKRPPLVAEIGRLLVEYPEKDWKALAGWVRDRALMENIAAAIDDALAVVARSAVRTKRARQRPRVSVLDEVAREDRAKAEILLALKSKLSSKDQPVTLAYIRALASSLGMKEELATRREQVVNQIVGYLADKTTDEIKAALSVALPAQQRQGQEFDRWVDLILGGDRSKPRPKHPAADD